MSFIAGLGNPGPRYTGTRHNVGFLVVDRIARRLGVSIDGEQAGAKVTKAHGWGGSVLLAKPWTFMNRSGGPVQALASYYKIPVEEVVVVHDDLDLPFGDVRVKRGGGHGGHNGLRDIHRHLGADHLRVRCGIGRPPSGWDTAAYVLGQWSSDEAEQLEAVVDQAADAAEAIVAEGVQAAMNRFNVRTRPQSGSVQGCLEAPACP